MEARYKSVKERLRCLPGLKQFVGSVDVHAILQFSGILHITIPEMHHNNCVLSKHKYLFYAT